MTNIMSKNSFKAKEIFNDISLKDNEILISFDVKSLFTNIPLELTFEI